MAHLVHNQIRGQACKLLVDRIKLSVTGLPHGNVLNACVKRMTSRKAYGHRKFYALPEEYPLRVSKVRSSHGTKKSEEAAKLIKYIDENVIGKNTTFSGPYGRRKGNYHGISITDVPQQAHREQHLPSPIGRQLGRGTVIVYEY